jgi:diguanylate cyclase (GGDEF)-like protein
MSDEYGTERVYAVTRIHDHAREQDGHRRSPAHRYPVQPPPPAEVADAAEVLGLPAGTMSPEVMAALSGVIAELERLRWLDRQHQHRESYLEQQSDRHSVVPVLNRRAFMRELEALLTGPEPPHGVVVVMHVRGVEAICGVQGLAAGDGALRHVGSNILGSLRKTDLVGLLGISDFSIVLPGDSIAEAREKTEEIIRRINAQPYAWLGQAVTLDIGCGFHTLASGESAETALAEADRNRRGWDG